MLRIFFYGSFGTTATGKEADVLPPHPRKVSALTFCPDGSLMVSKADGQLTLWNARTGTQLRRFPGADFHGFSADGRTVFT